METMCMLASSFAKKELIHPRATHGEVAKQRREPCRSFLVWVVEALLHGEAGSRDACPSVLRHDLWQQQLSGK
jgi:hypothetical protein